MAPDSGCARGPSILHRELARTIGPGRCLRWRGVVINDSDLMRDRGIAAGCWNHITTPRCPQFTHKTGRPGGRIVIGLDCGRCFETAAINLPTS